MRTLVTRWSTLSLILVTPREKEQPPCERLRHLNFPSLTLNFSAPKRSIAKTSIAHTSLDTDLSISTQK